MKCYSIQDLEVMEGVPVVRAMRPHIACGQEKVFLDDQLAAAVFDCYQSKRDSESMRFVDRLGEVALLHTGVDVASDGRARLCLESGEESRQRALVVFDLEMAGLGVAARGTYTYLGTHANLAPRTKVRRVLASRLHCNDARRDPAVTKIALALVMDKQSSVEILCEYWRYDARNLFVNSLLPPRKVLDVRFDGDSLQVTDLRLSAIESPWETLEKL